MKKVVLVLFATLMLGCREENRTDNYLSKAKPPVIIISKYNGWETTATKLIDGDGNIFTSYDRSFYSLNAGDTVKPLTPNR